MPYTNTNLWATRPPTLDRLLLRLDFDGEAEATSTVLYAEGRCSRRKRPLWTHEETLPTTGRAYTDLDGLVHIFLTVAQDRPTTEAALHAALMGWCQDELPFG